QLGLDDVRAHLDEKIGPSRQHARLAVRCREQRQSAAQRFRGLVSHGVVVCLPGGVPCRTMPMARASVNDQVNFAGSKRYTRAVVPPAILAPSSAGTPARILARISRE